MAYTPTEWKTGDIVSSERMNKIQNGIKNNQVLVVHATKNEDQNYILDKTWKQIYDAPFTVILSSEQQIGKYSFVMRILYNITDGIHYDIITNFFDGNNYIKFTADTENDYPMIYKVE